MKKQSQELEQLKEQINFEEKNNIFDKIFQSSLVDKLIIKLQSKYHQISNMLFDKFDLRNELRQGKIFTIIITILIFLFLIVLTTFFAVMLNSILGLNLIFSLLKYSLFFIKWGYTILKNKGKLIIKYLSNLFPNSKILKEKSEIKIENLPIFENNILMEIQNSIRELENLDIDSNIEYNIILEIRNIIEEMKLNDENFVSELRNIDYKRDIISKLNSVNDKIIALKKKNELEKQFYQVKIELEERLDENISKKCLNKKLIK